MSIEIARYQFHAWARKGIANTITDVDDLGTDSSITKERAEAALGVELNGTPKSKSFCLIGPGDIIGVHSDMIVRTEPRHWISDFESNYLGFIEFYDEDFLWRFTPAAPADKRLRPWLFLLILKEDEFERSGRRDPLPSINIKSKAVFPPFQETWLWAHVHSNADIPDSELSDYERFLLSLNQTVSTDPDQVYCRLLSPRKLEPNTHYCAFLIPAFETGRLAGLKLPTDSTKAQSSSWDENGAKGEMPYYFEWYFQTGVNADFESLVKMLEPRSMDQHVGIRDMDCHKPGFVKADGTAELPGTQPELLGLEGALKSPTAVSTVFPAPGTSPEFQQELQKIVNLPFEIVGKADSGDPIISLPLYGGQHAKTSASDTLTLDISKSGWLHALNKDPRNRVPSGFGTRVVQENQDEYMRKAWQQVTEVVEANKRIKLNLLYMKVAFAALTKNFMPLPQTYLLAVSKPVLTRIMGSPTTIAQQITESRLPMAVFSGAFRRLIRPQGKFAKNLGAVQTLNYEQVVNRLNDGTLTAAPPKGLPAGMPNTAEIAGKIFPHHWPAWLLWLMKHSVWVLLLLLVFLLLGLFSGFFLPVLVLSALVAVAWNVLTKLRIDLTAAEELKDPQKQADSVAGVPTQPEFTLVLSDEATTPAATPSPGGGDSVEAKNFRSALDDYFKRLTFQIPVQPDFALDMSNAYVKVSAAIHPYQSFPFRLSYYVRFPDYIPLNLPEKIFEAMAYPDFEDAMYKKLVDISGDLLLPNLKLIPANTISLLKTNQKFIESYMVGLNHEMGRELLWREYPTDQRGSYFRQFWEVKGVIRPKTGKTEAQLKEEYKDIKPIHTWQTSSLLGSHDNRQPQGQSERTVLLIRGDLLKRYPNTLIFAQKAIPGKSADEPVIDLDLSAEEFESQIKFPLFGAEMKPDIKLYGFDLTPEQAKGTAPTPGFSDTLGWFFIIQEIPGEPRFGMDIKFDPGTDGLSWDDLAWGLLPPDTRFIKAGVQPKINVTDKNRWGADSANMAYVLFQKPSMVAIHAKEMLDKLAEK